MKLSNLMERDFKLIEKKKIWFIIPACIVALAIVAMIIFGCVTGEPLNLGMDFTGGYTVNVKLANKLTNDTYSSYRKEIENIIENLSDENGENYGLKVSSMQRQGSEDTASIYVRYKAVASESVMENEVNPAVQNALQEAIFKIVPVVSGADGTYSLQYPNFPLGKTECESVLGKVSALATVNGIQYDGGTPEDFDFSAGGVKTLSFTVAETPEGFAEKLVSAASISDKYSGQAVTGDIISATVSGELLTNALLAICLSIVLMLVYIAFRFEVSSGLSAIVALLHDILIMFSFMAIFHIEINSTFIAALITILGYSINNTIIVFDRIRENMRSVFHKNSTATFIANTSIKETLMRSVNTSVTTLLTITMVALIGVSSIRIFALPIIVGLLAGTFSSIFISPSVWALWKDRKRKSRKSDIGKSGEGQKAAIA